MKIQTFSSSSATDTEKIGVKLAELLCDGAFVALFGTLGVGKTAFVRGMASIICPDSEVRSPTFSIINEYKKDGKVKLVHMDAYRIESDDSLYSTGFYDYIQSDTVIAAEWSENIPFALPDCAVKVTITKIGGEGGENDTNRRSITIENFPGFINEADKNDN